MRKSLVLSTGSCAHWTAPSLRHSTCGCCDAAPLLTRMSCLVQVGVFSATLPPEALEITRKFMNKPVSNEACLAVP